MTIRVGVVGYGTIGKRVADAVKLQKDMELVGITGNSYNYKMEVANMKCIPIYTMGDDASFKKNGITPAGTIKDLMGKIDVAVDCSPKPYGKENKEKYYNPAGIKAIYQGGEKASVGEVSFVAQCNYDECIGKNHIRVVSCNTTGLARTIHALDQAFGVHKVRATLIRRGTDPGEIKKGPINAIVPSLELPSHHGPDVRTVLHNVEVFTQAIVVPTTLMHMHNLSVKLNKEVTAEEVVNLFKNTTRVRVVREAEQVLSTAQIMELARDLGYPRGDMMEICVWEEGIGLYDNELFFMQAIHQESDVIPENIDAIRAAMGFADGKASIEMTNKALNLK